MLFPVQTILNAALSFYSLLILVYVLMSWFPVSGFMEEAHRVLASIVEPYLGIFRGIVPTAGMIDFSPWVAILVLWAVRSFVVPYIPF
jgi:YggT family protein